MSLLKWRELAKKKSELGNKVDYVRRTILQSDIDKQTSHESFKKIVKPITTKLDDVVASNLNISPVRRRPKKKEAANGGIDYAPEVDPYEDMDVEGLIDFGDYVPPEQEKQIVPKPPTYEESLKDVLEGKKEIYVDPQYLPQEPQEMPPEYDDMTKE